MFANERQNKICEMIKASGSVTVDELMRLFSVSIETVRRDLLFLEKQKLLQRVHGGAISLPSTKQFKKLTQRIDENRKQKYELSQAAVSLIAEDDIIVIDAGSTALEFIEAVKDKLKRLTILTNCKDVFDKLYCVDGFNIILCGGYFLKEESAFYGQLAIETIKKMHVSKAFIFPDAISLKNGITDYSIELVEIQQAYLNISDTVVILADSTKFEKNAFIKLSEVSPAYTFVTDSELSDEIYNLYKNNGINIYRGAIK